MHQGESHNVVYHHSHSEPGQPPRRFHPSAKLTEKMEKLAKWRIDPSWIEFPKDPSQLHGGHATITRAFLNFPSDTSGNTDETDARVSAGKKTIAVKRMKITADKDRERLLGLTLREAGFLVELSHEHIVELEGFVEDVLEGIIWLLFPWESNGSLKDFIASRNWEIPERISLINDVAMGVDYLHGRNPPICHGDLKSVNILVNSDFRALITDFGSARRLTKLGHDAGPERAGNEWQPATRLEAKYCASTNTITLTDNEFTLRWAAPELLNDEPPTVKIDIWAFGWIAYEVMTNAIPFEDVVKSSTVIKRVVQGDLPSITDDVRMSLILRLCCLISECWSTDPNQRPAAIYCQKSLSWMPMIIPSPNRVTATTIRSSQLHIQLGDMHQHQGDYVNASKFYTEALGILTDTADLKGRADVLYRLGGLHRLQGKAEDAVASYTEALEIFTGIDDRRMKARALWGLAQTYKAQGKHIEAATLYSDALQILTDINDISEKARPLFGLAEVHRLQQEYSQAITFYSDALRISTDIGDRQGSASAMWGLAEVHRLQDQYDRATAFYSDALQIYTDIGDSRGRAFALVGLAGVERGQGGYNDSTNFYDEAAKLFEQVGHARMAAFASQAATDIRRRVNLRDAA